MAFNPSNANAYAASFRSLIDPEVFRRGAKDTMSNDATVALNNAMTMQFNAEKALAAAALREYGANQRNQANADLRRDLLDMELEYNKGVNEDARKQSARAALAQIALGGFGDAAKPQPSDPLTDMIGALKFNQSLRNDASNQLSDSGLNPQANIAAALQGLVRPKSKRNKQGGIQLNPTPKDQAPNVKLEGFNPDTKALFEYMTQKLKPKT